MGKLLTRRGLGIRGSEAYVRKGGVAVRVMLIQVAHINGVFSQTSTIFQMV